MHRILALGAAVLLFCEAVSVAAQPSALKELYGKGVHAYNAGSYDEADQLLSEAIDAGSKDPRCRYFRGLSRLRMGMEDGADEDFAAGAELEVADTDRFYAVSKSLTRTQGSERVLLEKHRTKARLAAYKRAQELRVLKERGIRDAAEQVELQPAERPSAPVGRAPEAAEPDPMDDIKDEPKEPAEDESSDADKPADDDTEDADDSEGDASNENTVEDADTDDSAMKEEGEETDAEEGEADDAEAEGESEGAEEEASE